MAVTGNLTVNLDFKDVQTLINVTGFTQTITLPIKFGGNAIQISDGTGNLQLTKVWAERRTLAATTYTYDLTALAVPNAATTGTGSPVLAFTKIKIAYAFPETTTDGAILSIGNAGSNKWSAPWSQATNIQKVMPQSPWLISNLYSQGTNPWTVDSSNKNVLVDSGANTITYVVLFAGV